MKNLPAPVFRLDGSHVATVPPLTSEQEGVSWPAHQQHNMTHNADYGNYGNHVTRVSSQLVTTAGTVVTGDCIMNGQRAAGVR